MDGSSSIHMNNLNIWKDIYNILYEDLEGWMCYSEHFKRTIINSDCEDIGG